MRIFNRLFAGLIVICVMAISSINTFHLFASFGFTFPYTIVATVMTVALLVIGSVNIIRAHTDDDLSIFASFLPIFLSIGVIGWGNVLFGTYSGAGGIVLGVFLTLVPLSIIIFLNNAKKNSEL